MSQIGSGGGWSEIGSDLILKADEADLLIVEEAPSRPFAPFIEPDQFSGNSDGNSACSATFAGIRLIVGNSAGASTPSATFAGIRLIAGGSAGSSTPSANFNGVRLIVGGSVGSSTVSGTFSGGGAAQCGGNSLGSSTCSATFMGGQPSPPQPISGGSGGSVSFTSSRWRPSNTPRDAKRDKKDAKPHPVRAKRKVQEAKRDFRPAKDYFDIPAPEFVHRPLPVAKPMVGIEPVPLSNPVFLEGSPGVGWDTMNALMATLAALDAEPAVNGLKEEFFQSMPEEDLELVLLADEITS